MRTLSQNGIDFLSLGSLYALLALGLALVFGVMRSINFAHGELITLGAYALFFVGGDKHFVFMFAAAIGTSVIFAILMERVAFRPIREAKVSTQLVATFGVGFLIQNAVSVAFGAQAKSVRMPVFLTRNMTIFDFRIPNLDWVTAILFVMSSVGLALFLKRTRLGTQMRAAAEDFQMAQLLGVRANTVIAAAFAISGVLAGSAAIVLVARSGTMVPGMGLRPVILGFVAIILGGMGSLVGAAVGGFALSFLTVTLNIVLPLAARPFRDTVVFLAVIAIFAVRPRGLVSVRKMETRA